MPLPRTPPQPPREVARSRRFATLILVGMVASTSPLPYNAVAVAPLVWAGVEAVRSIQARSSASPGTQPASRSPAGGIVFSVLGLVLVCVLTVLVLAPYAVYDMAKSLQDCIGGANTAIAAADCNAHFNARLNSIVTGLLSSGQRAGG